MSGGFGIGVMCKAPVAGLAKTRLATAIGAEGAARLAAAFLDDVAATAASAANTLGAALFAFVRPISALNEVGARFPTGTRLRPQADGDLGAVMWDALEVMLRECPQGAILVGSDVPLLRPAVLVDATRALAEAPAVFGPAEDGGYYLVGVRGKDPRPLFDPLPWSTPEVMRLTRTRAAQCGLRLAEVAMGWDVDEEADLERLRTVLGGTPESVAPATRRALMQEGAQEPQAAGRDRS